MQLAAADIALNELTNFVFQILNLLGQLQRKPRKNGCLTERISRRYCSSVGCNLTATEAGH